MRKIFCFTEIENSYIKFLIILFLIITFNNAVSYFTEDVYGYSSLYNIPNHFIAFILITASNADKFLLLLNISMLYSLFKEIRIKWTRRMIITKIIIYTCTNIALLYYSFYAIRNFD